MRVAKLSPGSAVPYLLAVSFFITATLSEGVPALRHDWFWPVERDAFLANVASWTSGWDLTGLGHPATHVAQYLLVVPILAVGALLGSAAALAFYLALIGLAIAHAAVRIARRQGLTTPGAVVLTAFLCLNPWVYSELVAGHLGMLLAYGSTLLVWTELSAAWPDARTTVLGMFGASFQPQFFALAFAACVVRGRHPAARTAAAYGLIAILPFVAGIVSHPGVVAGTPLTLRWEDIQSVRFPDVLLVRGYFARYDAVFAGVAGSAGAGTFAALAVAAAVLSKRVEGYALGTLGVVLLLACVAAGTHGPLAAAMVAGFANVPAVGLYRELFDLVGLIAAGYALLAALAFARFPLLVWPGAIATACLASVWLLSPPSRLWLSGTALPVVERGDGPGRYATVPPIQPFTFEGRGSGVDPALMYRSLQNTALNTYAVEFPEATALAAYWRGADARELARLGVRQVLCRPGFHESIDATGVPARAGGDAMSPACAAEAVAVPAPAPLFGLQTGSRLCSLCRNVGDGNVFFGDAGAATAAGVGLSVDEGRYLLIPPLRGGTDPHTGWIDARLVFAAHPDLAQSFGGAFTVANVPLRVAPASEILVDVRGTLRDVGGTLIARDTRGYRWERLPAGGPSLLCSGQCALALEGAPPAQAPLEGGAVPARALGWHRFAPWLAVVELPAGDAGLVRSLESYDASWFAFSGGHVAGHLRLDGVLNGWAIAARRAPEPLVILHGVSVVQLALELLGVLAFAQALVRRYGDAG